ncbi:cyclase family protein [Colwelliaceae bacterium 6441]
MSNDKNTESWLEQFVIPGMETPVDMGASNDVVGTDILAALQLANQGVVYDLDPGRWPGMSVHPVHPPFTLTTYRTPRGAQVDQGKSENDDAFLSELMISSMHAGTHIDALCHVTCGPENKWYDDRKEADELGDHGAKTSDGAALPPFICRGILIDIPASEGVEFLPAGHGIDWEQTQRALEKQSIELRKGDAVMFRTGFMPWWLQGPQASEKYSGAGINLEVAKKLADIGVILVGADTEGFEQLPSVVPKKYLPVHVELLIKRGIHIIELAYLEDLARDNKYEFLFICLPLRVRGTTGSMVRPIAIV